jgi:hypothetical protein
MFRIWYTLIASLLALSVSTRADEPRAFNNAYYLFLTDRGGCESCYVPLILTADPLEVIAKRETETQVVMVITYERDSIWQYLGMVPIQPSKIEVLPRKVNMYMQDLKTWRQYRYQRIQASEAIQLLESPEGKIFDSPEIRSSTAWSAASRSVDQRAAR